MRNKTPPTDKRGRTGSKERQAFAEREMNELRSSLDEAEKDREELL